LGIKKMIIRGLDSEGILFLAISISFSFLFCILFAAFMFLPDTLRSFLLIKNKAKRFNFSPR
jgi:hypothetical protein